MVKNVIILFLLVFVFTQTDLTGEDMLEFAQSTVDKMQELIYYMKEKV